MPRTLTDLMESIDSGLKELRGVPDPKSRRGGSRFVGEGADDELLDRLSAATPEELDRYGLKVAEPNRLHHVSSRRAGGGPTVGVSLADVLLVQAAHRGLRPFTRDVQASAKALAESTGSAGGFLVPVEVSDQILEALRARTVVYAMGVTRVPVRKELDMTSLSTGASAAWTAENARIAVSEQTFAEAPLLKPKSLDALVPVSSKLLRDSEGLRAAEAVVRRDMVGIMANTLDAGFLHGSGVDPIPLGIGHPSRTGLTPPPAAFLPNGATPTFDLLKQMVQALRNTNAPFERPGWIMNPRTLGTLEMIKTATGENRYLGDADDLLTIDPNGGGGTLLGYPFRTTTAIPTNITFGTNSDTSRLYFGSDWDEAWVGEGIDEAGGEEFELALSSEASYTPDGGTTWISAFQNKQTLFRTSGYRDINLRRPSLWTIAHCRP